MATALDRTYGYWTGDRSERQRLGWLKDTRDGVGAVYLPIQEYLAILMASNSYTGAECEPYSVFDRSRHKSVRKTLDDLT